MTAIEMNELRTGYYLARMLGFGVWDSIVIACVVYARRLRKRK